MAYVFALGIQQEIYRLRRALLSTGSRPSIQNGWFAFERALLPTQSLFILKQWVLWVCYCFGLVGICCLVAQCSGKKSDTRENVFSAIRERPFHFLKSVSLFFGVLTVAYLAMNSIIGGIAILQIRAHIPFTPWDGVLLAWIAVGLVSAVLVRWAFTVPLAVLNGMSFRMAMRGSDRLTDHRTIALWALLMESELTGYLAMVAPSYVLFYLHVQPSALTYYSSEAIALLLSVITQAPFMVAVGLVLAATGTSQAADLQEQNNVEGGGSRLRVQHPRGSSTRACALAQNDRPE